MDNLVPQIERKIFLIRGKRVMLDKEMVDTIYKDCLPYVKSIKIIEVPVKHKGKAVKDVTDWFEAGLTDDEFKREIEHTVALKEPIGNHVNRLSEIHHMDIKTKSHIIDGVLPDESGVYLLAGKAKTGKSILIMNWLHEFDAKGLKTLYIFPEGNDRLLAMRLQKHGKIPKDHIYVTYKVTSTIGLRGLPMIDEWHEQNPDLKICIIDTLSRVRPKTNNPYNYYEDVDIFASLQSQAQRLGIIIIVVTHTKKGQVEDQFDGIIGSTGIQGSVSGSILLKRDRQDAETDSIEANIYVTGWYLPEKRFTATMETETLTWTIEPYTMKVDDFTDKQKRYIMFFAEYLQPLTLKEVMERLETGTKKGNVYNELNRLVNDNVLKKDDNGAYSLNRSALQCVDEDKNIN